MMVLYILIVLSIIAYPLLGITICDKLGILYNNDDFLDFLIDGIFIAFWPIMLMIHFLLNN